MEKVTFELPPLDPKEVINDILNKSEFVSSFGKIKEWASYKDLKTKEFKHSLLLGELADGGNTYTGLLSQDMKREHIGIQRYKNGDVYLGQWEKNQRNGLGIYMYFVEQPDKKQKIEMFLGKFKNDVKEAEGLYVWIEENIGSNDLLAANFEAYVGEISEQGFKRGIYLTKIEKLFYIYYGEFKDGEKNDDKCYFFDNNGEIDRVFRGKISEGKVKEGFFITFFKEDIDDSAFMRFGDDGIPNEVSTKEMLGEKLVSDINNEAFNFREILYEEDWFGMIYETCKEAYKVITTNKLLDFDADKSFNQIVKVVGSYKNVSLYPKLCVKMAK